MGCSAMTLWNRFNQWKRAGLWQELHAVLLDKLWAAGRLAMNSVVDSSSVRAMDGKSSITKKDFCEDFNLPKHICVGTIVRP